jgi:hypothetical protein
MRNFTILVIVILIYLLTTLYIVPYEAWYIYNIIWFILVIPFIELLNKNFSNQDPVQDRVDSNYQPTNDWLSYILFGK